jgi:hypothetical protein
MEFWIVLAVVAATGGWLAFRSVRSFRRTLRGEDHCGGDCAPVLPNSSLLTPPEALVRKRRSGAQRTEADDGTGPSPH